MRVSAKVDYALRAMTKLAAALALPNRADVLLAFGEAPRALCLDLSRRTG